MIAAFDHFKLNEYLPSPDQVLNQVDGIVLAPIDDMALRRPVQLCSRVPACEAGTIASLYPMDPHESPLVKDRVLDSQSYETVVCHRIQ